MLLIDLYQRNGKSRHFLDEDEMRRFKDFVIDKEKRATFDLYQETYVDSKISFSNIKRLKKIIRSVSQSVGKRS